MKTVYKYSLKLGETKLRVPLNSKPIHFGVQHGRLCVWIEEPKLEDEDANEKASKRIRNFIVHGTGHTIKDNQVHIASCFEDGGILVWHLYEEVNV